MHSSVRHISWCVYPAKRLVIQLTGAERQNAKQPKWRTPCRLYLIISQTEKAMLYGKKGLVLFSLLLFFFFLLHDKTSFIWLTLAVNTVSPPTEPSQNILQARRETKRWKPLKCRASEIQCTWAVSLLPSLFLYINVQQLRESQSLPQGKGTVEGRKQEVPKIEND